MNLTLEGLEQLFKDWRNPLQDMARQLGLDLDKGDYLIIPEHWLAHFPELEPFKDTKGIKWYPHINEAYAFKASEIKLPIPQFPLV